MDPVHMPAPSAGRTPDWLEPEQVRGSQAPTAPRWLWPAITTVVGIVGLALGGIIGGTTAGGSDVPQACLDAIAAAEEGFGYTGDAMVGVQDAFWAISELDTLGVERATDDIAAATDQIEALTPRWDTARTDCRAAAE